MTTLTRADLARRIAETAGQPVAGVDQIIRSFLEAIRLAVASGESVDLHQFGTFEQIAVAARPGRDPKTGEPIVIPAHHRPVFRAYGALRAAVRGAATPPRRPAVTDSRQIDWLEGAER